MERLGKGIIVFGGVIVVIGIIVWVAGDKLRFLGRLPGDIRIEREHVKVYIPITTMILLSLLLTGIMWVIQRFK